MDKNEAIKIIRSNFPTGRHQLCEALETLIPELKESDDEKIRKTLKSFFDSEISDYGNVEWRNGIRYGEIVSWLEKQGKQKPADKVEPKFKIGDWILIDNPCKIISIEGNYIVQYCDDEKTREISKKFCESSFHLWTIQDAKKGDVLVWNDCGDEYIFVFDKLIKDCAHAFIEFNVYLGTIEDVNRYYQLNKLYPATKEQCDLLFQKMKETGYEWNAEKKELNEIKQETELPKGEDYGIDSLYHAARILEKTLGDVEGYQSDDGILEHKCAIEAVNRLYKQKPAKWSEDDEKMFKSALWHVKNSCSNGGKNSGEFEVFNWLKSLKDRVQS